MHVQQQHLPKDRPATESETWGFTIWEFITGNWLYLLGIIIILAVFFFARYSWGKENKKNN